MKKFVVALTMGTLLATAGQASAQVAWDAPFLAPPKASPGLGLFLTDPSYGDLGFVGTWRSSGRPTSLGFRLGLANDWSDQLSVLGGIDVSGALNRSSSDFPLDIDWIFGAGLGVGHHALISFPLGLSVGHTFVGDGVSFTPYVTPRVSLDARMGGGVRNDTSLRFAVDLGLDLAFQPSWRIRFGGTFGDREAVALGIVF
jgi:hypothetical protein